MIGACRLALAPSRDRLYLFAGTSACLAALFRARRFEELIELAGGEHVYWAYKRWAVRALAAQGRKADALRLAESSRGPWAGDREIDRLGAAWRRTGAEPTSRPSAPLPGSSHTSRATLQTTRGASSWWSKYGRSVQLTYSWPRVITTIAIQRHQ